MSSFLKLFDRRGTGVGHSFGVQLFSNRETEGRRDHQRRTELHKRTPAYAAFHQPVVNCLKHLCGSNQRNHRNYSLQFGARCNLITAMVSVQQQTFQILKTGNGEKGSQSWVRGGGRAHVTMTSRATSEFHDDFRNITNLG